ncbi:MAG: relaxase domain-containing protein, partial [Candidatus Dormibacteraeota bacterium]|nr:relaxase domain-containing protein [Candidatus Dormibacteraeota bacterium]
PGHETAGEATAYLANPQATGDYYSEGDRAFMRWVATARAHSVLGLDRAVVLWKLERLLKGQHPITGYSIRRWGPNGTMVGGHDVTVSPAPKSVSILWALADPELRTELELMVGTAADAAFQGMLRRVPLLKERYGPGANDFRNVLAEDYVAVEALHTTARLSEAKPNVPDPDLHVHCVLMGTVDRGGRLRAIDSRPLVNNLGELGADASADLAEQLRMRGFEIEREVIRDSHGNVDRIAWEIKGVPRSLIGGMSSRTQEIESLKTKYRELYGKPAEGVQFERFLLAHRGPKSKRSAEELRAAWIAEALEHGYGPDQVAQAKAEADARREAGIGERGEKSTEAEQFRREILADLNRQHALVPERELDKLAQQRAVGLLEPNQARLVIARMFGQRDLLMTADGHKVTTLETLALEQRAMAAAEKLLQSRRRPPADPKQLEAEFRQREEEGGPFDHAQKDAIALATSGAHFVSITGPAGTGKGYAARSMVNIWHNQGRQVIAVAVAGRTSQQAEVDSGADVHYTLDGLIHGLASGRLHLEPSQVLLMDEAGMVDHYRYAPTLEAAAQSGASLVQIGDDKQLSPVEAGGLWTITHQLAAERNLAVELETIRRARNPAEAQAWTDLRDGRIEEGLLWYRQEKRLHLYESRPELLHGIVNHWWATDPTGTMVIDTTNAERDSANRIAQSKRLEAGELGSDVLELTNGRQLHVGDRVLFNEIHRLARGQRVENGTPATVLSVEPKQVALELQEPAGSRTVNVDAAAPLELAYARHVYKAQGMTTEVANIAIGPQTSQQRLYVMASRSRESTHVHAVRAEVEELGADAEVLEPAAELTASELASRVEARQAAAEEATIREIAAQARPEAKEAIGPNPTWSEAQQPEHAKEAVSKHEAEARAERRPEFQADYVFDSRQLDREAEVTGIRMFSNGTVLTKDQVIRFPEALEMSEPAVAQGELGVVRSVHQGGITYDYGRVELVGGRMVNVFQSAAVEAAHPDIKAQDVLGQRPTMAQRDPYSLSNLPLQNGLILQEGDRVQFAEAHNRIEAGSYGRVTDVQRHTGNRAQIQLEGSDRLIEVYSGAPLQVVEGPTPEPEALVSPAPEPARPPPPDPQQQRAEAQQQMAEHSLAASSEAARGAEHSGAEHGGAQRE